MPVKVVIPTPLRAYAGKQESVQLQAATVGEALSALTSQFADLKKHLFTEDGRLRSFVNVYVNDEDIRYLQKDQTPVREGDVVSIVPSIAGGARAQPLMKSEGTILRENSHGNENCKSRGGTCG